MTETASSAAITADPGENPCAASAVTTMARHQPAGTAVPAEPGIHRQRATIAAAPTTTGQHRVPAGTASAVVTGRRTTAATVAKDQT
ncbi:MAG: hypothetical protein WBB00_22475, partial [Mycobacterium sp.]